jgi:ribonuclease R
MYRVHEPPSAKSWSRSRSISPPTTSKLALGQVITPGLFNRMLIHIA